MRRKVKRVLIALALLAAVLAAVVWLCSFTGLTVTGRLRQTLRSLPPPPPRSVLIRADDYFAGGTSTVAYAHRELYGTDRPLEEVLQYYRQKLLRQGWRLQHDPATTPLQLYLQRGRDEALHIAGGRYALVGCYYRATPEGVGGHATVYRIEVTRTDFPIGFGLTPQPDQALWGETGSHLGSKGRSMSTLRVVP